VTVLESLVFDEYIMFLEYNKIKNIDVYKEEYKKYLEDKEQNISDELKFFLEEREKVKVKKLGITIEKRNFPKR